MTNPLLSHTRLLSLFMLPMMGCIGDAPPESSTLTITADDVAEHPGGWTIDLSGIETVVLDSTRGPIDTSLVSVELPTGESIAMSDWIDELSRASGVDLQAGQPAVLSLEVSTLVDPTTGAAVAATTRCIFYCHKTRNGFHCGVCCYDDASPYPPDC